MKGIKEKIEYLRAYQGRPLRFMEVCGTHTAAIFKHGLRSMLPSGIRLIAGPGCPVCVTPAGYIDRCVEYALRPGHALACFGDMMKVPGSGVGSGVLREVSREGEDPEAGGADECAVPGDMGDAGLGMSLAAARGEGGRVELVYSPFEIVGKAASEPETMFVLAAVGFETTAPAFGLLMDELIENDIRNVKLLCALKRAMPAIEWVCANEPAVDGFICPGHVSVITGSKVYEPLAARYGKPFAVAGFEAAHLVNAIYELTTFYDNTVIKSCDNAENEPHSDAVIKSCGDTENEPTHAVAAVSNFYGEAVHGDGNLAAKAVTEKYFRTGDAVWRGLGVIPDSGYYLKDAYAVFDAGSDHLPPMENLPMGCRCADVITGRIDPPDCPMFGARCKPEAPFGPCMVSAEGACGVWYQNSGFM